MKKILILLFFCVARLIPSFAQADSKDSAIAELKNATLMYQHAQLLSFDIAYYYSSEASPGIYVDSLKGSFKMNGLRYWYSLDSTETLVDTGNIVILYKEDKLMYLSKASSQVRQANPLTMMIGLLRANNDLQISMELSGGLKIIHIRFPENSVYKEIFYFLDASTGWLTKTKAWVKAGQLYNPAIRGQINTGNSYVILETKFANYAQNSFDAGALDKRRYFTNQGGEFRTTDAYSMYQIFLGKPGL